MEAPTIGMAKWIASKTGADQVIVIVREGGHYAGAGIMHGASYGKDRMECLQAKTLLNDLMDYYENKEPTNG